jgi:hypothetical protein
MYPRHPAKRKFGTQDIRSAYDTVHGKQSSSIIPRSKTHPYSLIEYHVWGLIPHGSIARNDAIEAQFVSERLRLDSLSAATVNIYETPQLYFERLLKRVMKNSFGNSHGDSIAIWV